MKDIVKQAASRLDGVRDDLLVRMTGRLVDEVASLRRRRGAVLRNVSKRSAALSDMPAPSVVKATLRRVSDLLENLASPADSLEHEVAEATPVTPMDASVLSNAPSQDNCVAAGTSPPVAELHADKTARSSQRGGNARSAGRGKGGRGSGGRRGHRTSQ